MGVLGSMLATYSHIKKKSVLYSEIFCNLETVSSKQVEDQLFLKD